MTAVTAPEARLADEDEPRYDPNPVDTTDPAAITARLAEIEDEMAFVANEVSRAAFWRKKYKDERDNLEQYLYHQQTEGTIPERKAAVHAMMLQDDNNVIGRLAKAEAAYARYDKAFDGLDARRSILQSCLKMHLREQEPKHGQGSHHR